MILIKLMREIFDRANIKVSVFCKTYFQIYMDSSQTREMDQLNQQMEEMYDSREKNYLCTCGKLYKTDGWFTKL